MLAAGSVSPTQAELQAADDLARHQEALSVVSAFAAQLYGHMQTCTKGLAVKHDPDVLQACCKVAGGLVTSTLWFATTLLASPCLPHSLLCSLDCLHKIPGPSYFQETQWGSCHNLLETCCDELCLLSQFMTVQIR